MKNSKRRVVGLVLTAGLGLAAAGVGSRARAQDVPPQVATGQFGMMGAIRSEVVRLNVTNINLFPPGPCHATIEFVDASGNVLLRPDGTPVRRMVTLEAGQSAAVQFAVAPLLGRDQARLNFRPVLLVDAPPDPSFPPPCVPSAEVIDATTGQTRLLVPGALRTYSANHNETLLEDR